MVRLSAMGVGRISSKSMWTHVSGWPEPQQRPVRFVYLLLFFSAGYVEEAAAICLGGDLELSLFRSLLQPSSCFSLTLQFLKLISLFLLAYYLSIIYFYLFPYIYFYSIVFFCSSSVFPHPRTAPSPQLTPPGFDPPPRLLASNHTPSDHKCSNFQALS